MQLGRETKRKQVLTHYKAGKIDQAELIAMKRRQKMLRF